MRVKSIKIFSVILAVIMLLCNFTAVAAEREVVASGTSGNIKWSFYSNGELVISGSSTMPNYSTDGFPWYTYRSKIISATITDGVTSVGGNAFSGYSNLKQVTIPNSVKTIYGSAFYNCTALEEISVPDSVKYIDTRAFMGCSSLKNITIGSGVSSIEWSAFENCTELTKVYYTGDLADWCAIDFSESYGSNTCNPMYYASYLYIQGTRPSGNIVIPETVTTIPYGTFKNCKELIDITIPNSVTKIKPYAFYNCTGLKSVVIPDSITHLDNYIFYGCTGLSNVVIGNSVDGITTNAFSGCSGITELTMPASSYVDGSAFKECTNIDKVTLTKGSGKMYDYSDAGYRYTPWYIGKSSTVIIDDGVTDISEHAFYNCKNLKNLIIGNSVKMVDSYAFYNCDSLTNIYYTGNIAGWCEIDFGTNPLGFAENLYIDGKLVEGILVIHEGVTSIGSGAFKNRTLITGVEIPDSVVNIGASAFYNCTALKNITPLKNTEFIGTNAFYNTEYYNDPANWDNGFLYIGTNLVDIDIDKIADECKLYSKTTLVASRIFEKSNITSLDMPDSVKYINDYAFINCDYLESVNLSSNLVTLGKGAFYDCDSLTSIEIPAGISELSNYMFYGSDMLNNVVLNNGLVSIGEKAFYNVPKLTQLEIPGTVTSIDPTAFSGSGITDIYYGDNKAQWKRATNGESFDGVTVHYTLKSDDESVIIQHTDDNFTWEAGNVHLKVEDLTNVTTSYEQNGFYNRLLTNPIQVLDIKLVDGDDNPIQPLSDEKITVKIKASDEFMAMLKTALSSVGEYDIAADKIDFVDDSFVFEVDGETVNVPAQEKFLKSFKVIHWKSDAVLPTDHESFTHDMLSVKDGYIVLETNHFSEYAVCTDMLEIEQTELKIENGKTAQLKVTASEGETVNYTSSDESVATVDSNGVVTAVGPGTATITATVSDTGVSAKCTVNVPFRTFTVKWVVDGVVTEQEITEQSPLTAPAEAPEKAGYIFKGWSPAIPDKMPAKNLTFTAVFEAAPVAEIEIITAPTKTAYTYKSGNIDLSGIELKITYEDGYSETVTDTSKMTVSGFDSKKVGNQTVTVEYEGATVKFQVGVSYAWWQWIIRIILLGIFWY